jgi:hypothetical protein
VWKTEVTFCGKMRLKDKEDVNVMRKKETFKLRVCVVTVCWHSRRQSVGSESLGKFR